MSDPIPANVAADFETIARLMKQYPQLFHQVDPRDVKTVAEVIAVYLKDAVGDLEPCTMVNRRNFLSAFASVFGSRRVLDCTPFELKLWIFERYPGSAWTRFGANVAVQRTFNWAVRMRLVKENPFRGLVLGEEKLPNRDMKRDELQTLLRSTHAAFRRFMVMMWLTGARVGELRGLRWDMIDWSRGIAILHKHKTAKKTKRPRIIVFPPPAMKLLAWMKKHNHNAAAIELRRILENAPDRQAPMKEIVRQMKALGYSYRALYRARESIGATYKRVGGWREHGHTVYELPPDAEGRSTQKHLWTKESIDGSWVFISTKERPWTREGINATFGKLRKKCRLPMACKLYGLRHAYISEAVKRGVNLKALSLLVGHVNTSMIERTYCHVTDAYDFLHAAALQAVNGQADVKPTPQPAPAVNGKHTPPVERVTDPVVTLMLRRLMELEEKMRNPPPAPVPQKPKERQLQACHRVCYAAMRFAVEQEPALAKATDLAIFEWLKDRPEYAGQLPPSPLTFRRYLNQARQVLEGIGKQARRRQGFAVS